MFLAKTPTLLVVSNIENKKLPFLKLQYKRNIKMCKKYFITKREIWSLSSEVLTLLSAGVSRISKRKYKVFVAQWVQILSEREFLSCLFVCLFKGRIATLPDESNPYLQSYPG